MRLHATQQQVDAYLDGEMPAAERQDFAAHYNECDSCRAQVESRRELLRAIYAVKPEFQASMTLRQNVAAMLEGQAAPRRSLLSKLKTLFPYAQNGHQSPFALLFPAMTGRFALRGGFRYAWLLPILIGVASALYLSQQQARANRLVDMAIETHQQRLANAAPVEFQSASAREVTRWCNRRLSFAFRLPTYQDDSGDRSKYQLIGASRVSFRGKDAAYIAYRMGRERISLIVVSADQAIASGGEITKAKSLVFHSVRRDGLDVFTWSVHHLTYALVSDVKLPPKQSCVVCHADPKDRNWRQSPLIHYAPTHGGMRLVATGALPGLPSKIHE